MPLKGAKNFMGVGSDPKRGRTVERWRETLEGIRFKAE
jgi:hypothetical protein